MSVAPFHVESDAPTVLTNGLVEELMFVQFRHFQFNILIIKSP